MNVYSSGPKDEPTATGAAFKGVGVSTGKDIGKVFSNDEVADLTKKLSELTSKTTDPSARIAQLQEHAEEQAEILEEAYQNRTNIRNLRKEHDLSDDMFAEEEANAKAVIDLLTDPVRGNPFAVRLQKERWGAIQRERRQEKWGEIENLREKATIPTLHLACEPDTDGTFFLKRHVPALDKDRNPITRFVKAIGERRPVFNPVGDLYQISDSKAQLVESTSRNAVERNGRFRVPLNPPSFGTERGQSYFNKTTVEALAALWENEEADIRRDAMTERREISFTEGQTKKGVAVAHWPPQRPYLSGKRKGPLSIVISFTGKGNFTLEDVFSSRFEEFLALAVGQKLSLELPEEPADDADEETKDAFRRHKFLVNLINRRVEYEAHMSEREASREAEETVVDTDEPEEASSSQDADDES